MAEAGLLKELDELRLAGQVRLYTEGSQDLQRPLESQNAFLHSYGATENDVASCPGESHGIWGVRRVLGRIIEPGVLPVNSAETIERVPIHTDADGVVRVAGTRVTLDTMVAAFDAGATAEEIAQQYSSISLADVYSVITYYLRHKTEVAVYLHRRQEQAATVREEVERRFPPSDLRERLMARRR